MAAYLTTIDNPYDPVDDFDKWLMFDKLHDYNSCEKLARIANTSSAFSDSENEEEIERAIDLIVLNDFTYMFIKVKK